MYVDHYDIEIEEVKDRRFLLRFLLHMSRLKRPNINNGVK